MRILTTLFTAVSFATPLAAQDDPVANGSRIGNWVVLCDAVSVTETTCRVQQTLSVAESGQIVVNMMAAPRGEDAALLVAQVPMGVFLPGGAVYRTPGEDAAPQTEMVWQSCRGQVCEAAIDLSAADLEDFTASGSVLFGYRMSATAEPIIVSIEMGDLWAALEAIRPAP